jgi:hypothetical protein
VNQVADSSTRKTVSEGPKYQQNNEDRPKHFSLYLPFSLSIQAMMDITQEPAKFSLPVRLDWPAYKAFPTIKPNSMISLHTA